MKESAPSPDSTPPPTEVTRFGNRLPDHTRCFTPMDSGGLRRPQGLGRLAAHMAVLQEELEMRDESSAPAPPPPDLASPGFPTRNPLRPLVPNATIPFLQRVHARMDPEHLERRLSSAARAAAVAMLGAVVLFAVASSILFRTQPSAGPARPAATAPATGPARTSLSAAEIAEAMRGGLAALDDFMTASSSQARREAAAPGEPLPPALAAEGPVDRLARARVDRAGARVHRAGTLTVLLAPMADGHGMPHLAAVLQRGDRWRVDWRSVATPESLSWEQFAASPPRRPHLFRVLLSRDAAGAWAAITPCPDQSKVAVSAEPGSRVADDLGRLLAARGGGPLPVDVYFEASVGQDLRIVGWTQDKWTL